MRTNVQRSCLEHYGILTEHLSLHGVSTLQKVSANVEGLACASALESHADGSVATGRAIHIGHVLSKVLNKEGHPHQPGRGVAREADTFTS
jgi:hypothetical protein